MTFRKKILIVDHAASVNERVRLALENTGKYVVKEERDLRTLPHAARWFQPNLILLDVVLAGTNTSAIARELQSDPAFKDTPIIFLSGNSEGDDVVSGGILGGYSFLTSPMGVDDLVRYVADLLTGKSIGAMG
jgi:DNA-binding response OmpR family regulator